MSKVKYTVTRQVGQRHEEGLSNIGHDNANIRHLQAQVEEVSKKMRENLTSLIEREGNLEDMENRSKKLEESSEKLKITAHKIQQTFWKRNTKLIILCSTISTIVVILITGILYEVLRLDRTHRK